MLDQKTITQQNENYVGNWFELSGFTVDRLDPPDGRKGKNADWKFTKGNLTIICEVKTIFSGGQQGLTKQQYERRREEARQELDHQRTHLAEDETLLVDQQYLNFILGKTPFPKHGKLTEGVEGKKGSYRDFKRTIILDLKSDPQVNNLPFSISISMNSLYFPIDSLYVDFLQWLSSFVLWANKYHNSEHRHSSYTYKFDPNRQLENGALRDGNEAFVQITGPWPKANLDIGFIEGGVGYNEEGIASEIEKAIGQIHETLKKQNLDSPISMIAFWSASDFLNFFGLLYNDELWKEENKTPERSHLFDWAFSDPRYADLTAIALFDLRPPEGTSLVELVIEPDKLTPIAWIITNPYVAEVENILQKAITTEYCHFLKGIIPSSA